MGQLRVHYIANIDVKTSNVFGSFSLDVCTLHDYRFKIVKHWLVPCTRAKPNRRTQQELYETKLITDRADGWLTVSVIVQEQTQASQIPILVNFRFPFVKAEDVDECTLNRAQHPGVQANGIARFWKLLPLSVCAARLLYNNP